MYLEFFFELPNLLLIYKFWFTYCLSYGIVRGRFVRYRLVGFGSMKKEDVARTVSTRKSRRWVFIGDSPTKTPNQRLLDPAP